MAGSYGPNRGTCNTVVSYLDTCPRPSDSYPVAGTLAIVFLVCFLILGLVRACFYLCGRCGAPRPGSDSLRLQVAPSSGRNYAQGMLLVAPLALACVSLVFKVASLGLNRWDAASIGNAGYGAQVWWGLLGEKVQVGSQSVTQSYSDLCSTYQTLADLPGASDQVRNTASLCATQLAAGAITLVLGLGAVLTTVVSGCLALRVLVAPSRLARLGLLMWRFAGLAATATLSTVLCWACSAHMVVHHTVGEARLGSSWILMLVALLVDLALLRFVSRAVQATPNSGAQAEAEGVVAYGQAYAVLQPGPPVGVYPLNVQNQYPAQLPVGYGQPMQPQQQQQQQQQPQYAAPPHQPHSQVPYGIPYGQQQQQLQQQQQQRPPAYAPQAYGQQLQQPYSAQYQPPQSQNRGF